MARGMYTQETSRNVCNATRPPARDQSLTVTPVLLSELMSLIVWIDPAGDQSYSACYPGLSY